MSLDDPDRVERLLDLCIARGLVERDADEVRPSRAWVAWLQKAAEVVNRQAAETGFNPAGHPIALAVRKALAMKGERFDEADAEDAVALLTLLELAEMPPGKRAQYGPYP